MYGSYKVNKYYGLSSIEDLFRIIKSDLEGRTIHVRAEARIKAYFSICIIVLMIIRILQFKVLKHENSSTLNTDEREQLITAKKIKLSFNNFNGCSDKNGICLITKPNNEIELINKLLNIEEAELTTLALIDKFKND